MFQMLQHETTWVCISEFRKACSMCKRTYNVSALGVWSIYIYIYYYILPTESDCPKPCLPKSCSWFVPSFTKVLSIVWPGGHLHNKLYNQHCLLNVCHRQTWLPLVTLLVSHVVFPEKRHQNPVGKRWVSVGLEFTGRWNSPWAEECVPEDTSPKGGSWGGKIMNGVGFPLTWSPWFYSPAL